MSIKKKQFWVVPLLCFLFVGSSWAQSSHTPQSVYDNQNLLTEIKSIESPDNYDGGEEVLTGTVTKVEADSPDARFILKGSKNENYINVNTKELSMVARSNLFGTLVVVGQRVKVNCIIAGSGGFLYAIDIKKLPKLIIPTPSPKPTTSVLLPLQQSAPIESSPNYTPLLFVALVGASVLCLVLFINLRQVKNGLGNKAANVEQAKEFLPQKQPVTNSKINFCSSCGVSRPDEAKFCPSCGQQFGKESVDAKSKTSNGTLTSCGGIFGVVLLAVIVVAGLGLRDNKSQSQTDVSSTQSTLSISDKNIRESFDNMEALALKVESEKLFEDIRELRLEYEKSKDDPKKLEEFKVRMDLLAQDVKNGRY